MVFSNFSRPQWLFFDLDDTLWDFNKNSNESLHHVYEVFPLINQTFESFDVFSDNYHLHNSSLWKDFAAGRISSGSLKSERWRRTLFPKSDPGLTPKVCHVIDQEYLRFLSSQTALVEGATEMLNVLSKSFLLAVLSNGFIDTQYRKLKYSGLWKYITRTIVSDEAGFQKPDTRLYDYAIQETGATGIPIMIGDNPHTDIIGALKAGWKAIWFNPKNESFPYSVKDLIDNGIDPVRFMGKAQNTDEIIQILQHP